MFGNIDDVLQKISCKTNSVYSCLLTQEGRDDADKFIQSSDCTNPEKRIKIFKQWLEIEETVPPLELLWKLNEEELLFVTTYFYMYENYASHLYTNFQDVYCCETDSDDRQLAVSIISNVLVTLINTLLTFEEETRKCIRKIISSIIIEGIVLLDQERLTGCYISDILNSVYLFDSCSHEFAVLNIKQLLNFNLDVTCFEEVVSLHSQWTIKCMNDITKDFLLKIVSLLSVEYVLKEIELAVERTVNWKYFFNLISLLVVDSAETAILIKNLVDEWFKTSFEDSNIHLLTRALLVARHCCSEKAKYFNNYITWFGSFQLKNNVSTNLFFKLLTELVPYESPLYLKIQISKTPSVPSNCQNVISDYTSLAKTRLADLNESTEYLGLFNDYHETDKEGQEADVAKVILIFTDTTEIPKALLEAQIFRKQYFEKMFLKHLLSVGEKDDTTRAQLINKLNDLGKIPLQMYQAWKSL